MRDHLVHVPALAEPSEAGACRPGPRYLRSARHLTLWLSLLAATGCVEPPESHSASEPEDAGATPETDGDASHPPSMVPDSGPAADASPRPLSPPRIEIEGPTDVLRGAVTLHIVATDGRPLRALEVVEPAFLRGGLARMRVFGKYATAHLDLDFDSRTLDDGPFELVVKARTIDGRSTRRIARYHVANHGPSIRWGAPVSGAVVADVITIVAEAVDPDGVEALEIDSLDAPDVDPRPGALRVHVDTRLWPEGGHRLTLRARDVYGNETVSLRGVIVDNRAPDVLRGVAAFGGPVVRARVRAYRVTAEGRDGLPADVCPAGGCSTDADGAFAAPLVDGLTGPIRIRVSPLATGLTGARDPLTDSLVPVPVNGRLTALLAHVPEAPVTVDGVTTLADATAMHRIRSGASPEDAILVADALWSEHVCERCPLGSTPNASWAEGPHDRLSPPVQLAAIHAGLYRMAADMIVGPEAAAPSLTAWDVLDLLERDLTDGVLDGASVGSPRFDPRIDAYTARLRLARSIEAAIDAHPGWLAVDRESLRGAGGWLDAIAGRSSALWPADAAPLPLDGQPPVVVIHSPAPGSEHGPHRVRLEATAEDDGPPPRLYVVAPDGVSVTVLARAPGSLTAELDMSASPQGEVVIEVLAEDSGGLLGRAEVPLAVDHEPPTVALFDLDGAPLDEEAIRFTQADTYGFFARVDDPTARVEANHPAEIRWVGDAIFIVVRGFGPGRQPIEVTATDPAGNETRLGFTLHQQVEAPAIELLPFSYTPAGRGVVQAVDCVQIGADAQAPPRCNIRLVTQGSDRTPVDAGSLLPDDSEPRMFAVYPLDTVPAGAPVARIRVVDPTGADRVQRRARMRDGRWGPWQDFPEGQGGVHMLELAVPHGDPGGDSTVSSTEWVEIRATDAAGHRTVRRLVWQRWVIAPPLVVMPDPGYGDRDTPFTPGGYGFAPDEPSVVGLVEPGAPAVADGVRLARWRVTNPWSIPVELRVEGQLTIEHARSRAYASDAFMPGVQHPCAPGEFYRGAAATGRATSGCAHDLAALGSSGERLVTRRRPPFELARLAGDLVLPIEGGRLVLPPHGSALMLALTPPADLIVWPEFARPIPEDDRLFATFGAADAVMRTEYVDREAALRWSLTDMRFSAALPDVEPPPYAVPSWPLDDVHIERINPPLRPPQGYELR